MNLYEYVPFFGYLEEADKILGYPNYTNVRGKEELLSELLALEDDDKFGVELHNVHIQIFNALDYSCFIKIIDYCMSSILCFSYPFQILHVVIGFIGIFMINFRLIQRVINECHSY
jgi:hypothetical protein